MSESVSDIFFAIAKRHGLLDDEQIELVRGVRALDRMRGRRRRPVGRTCVEEGLLDARQARGLERGVRYYFVRKDDRRYAREALKRAWIPWWAYERALGEQKRAFHAERRLVRVRPLLRALGFITEVEDLALREQLASRTSSRRSRRGRPVAERRAASARRRAGAPGSGDRTRSAPALPVARRSARTRG